MKGIFSLEDAFEITGRGVVLTGRMDKGEVGNGDFILVNDEMVKIIGIEKFMKSFGREGDNVGLLIGNKHTKKEMSKLRGEKLIIEDISHLRDYKLKKLGIY